MRATLTLLTALLLVASTVSAQNVLVPSSKDTTNSTNSATPNLGLLPKKVEPAQVQPPEAQQPTLQAATQATPPLSQAPIQPTITPGGSLAPAENGVSSTTGSLSEAEVRTMMQQAGITDNATNITPEQQQRLQQLIEVRVQQLNQRPPTIIDEPQLLELPESYAANLPNALAVALSPKYVWGINDAQSIQGALGYVPQQIPSNCQLRIDTQLLADRDVVMRSVFSGQQSNLRYSGSIRSLNLLPKAVCNAPAQLPQSGRPIMRNGKMLIIPLTAFSSCPLPPATAKALELQYLGDGKVNCNYR